MLVLILLVALVHMAHRAVRKADDTPARMRTKLAFLLMGVAFLVLETKSVVQFSLLFGTTWINSSLVFLGVLTLILVANWTALKLDARWIGLVCVLLVASALLPFAVPLSSLLDIESWALRFVGATLLTFAPIFFANLLFSLAFRNQKVAEQLFGWNLVGTTLGGVVEYASMGIGYTNLALIVAVTYTIVGVLLRADAHSFARKGESTATG
jgi:hypothetical protein